IPIKFIEENDEIKIYDTTKPVLTKETLENFDYSLPKIAEINKKKKNVVKFKDTLRMAFNYVNNLQTKQKLLLFTMFLSAALIVLSFSSLSKATQIVESDFLYTDRRMIQITSDIPFDIEQIEKIKTDLNLDRMFGERYTQPINYFTFSLYEQSKNNTISFDNYNVLPNNDLKDGDYICRLDGEEGVVVDRWIIDELSQKDVLGYNFLLQAGGTVESEDDYQKFLGLFCYNSRLNYNVGKIVGICDTNNPNIYMDEKLMDLIYVQNIDVTTKYNINLYGDSPIIDYGKIDYNEQDTMKNKFIVNFIENLEATEYSTLDGEKKAMESLVLGENDILLNEEYYMKVKNYLEGEKNRIKFSDSSQVIYNIVGTFSSDDGVIIAINDLEVMLLDAYCLSGDVSFLAEDKEVAKEYLSTAKIDYYDWYQENYNSYLSSKQKTTTTLLVFSMIIFAASLIFLYFLMRSRLISRIYEIGVYRALGIKKGDVYKTFTAEIVILTLFSSMLGFVITSIILWRLSLTIVFSSFINFTWYSIIISFLFIWLINLVVGLLPVRRLLKQSPAEILSKYDI
ncbi:MAG: ABC transporter permease, partial [Bacilli bacterium]|nr:ABC transporter permease [Bacilli bacterium]